MSEAAFVELSLRIVALAFCALGARLALVLGGRIALDQALYAGVAAFTAAALGGPGGALAGVGLAGAVGAALGVLAVRLDPARAAALGLVALFGGQAVAPRLDGWTGGHMGRALGHPELASAAVSLVLAGLLVIGLERLARGRRVTAGVERARLLVQAPELHDALGLRATPVRMAIGAAAAGLAGVGGLLMAAGVEHLHFRAFGLSLSLDALAVGLLAGRGGPLGAARAVAWAGAWVGLSELLASHPEVHTVVLGLVLAGGALVRGRDGALR